MAITNQNQISFHESTLVSISQFNDKIKLSLDDVLVCDARMPKDVYIENINSISKNNVSVRSVSMEEEDGEVLNIYQQDEDVVLVVQWNNFFKKTQNTVVYKFCGEKVVLRVG